MESFVESDTSTVGSARIRSAPIDLAREYVKAKVQGPALNSTLSKQIKAKVKHSDVWLDRFQRVGDLLNYLRRFDVSHNDPIYHEIKKHNLLTFEDIVDDFYQRFEVWANDSSRITDFVIGEKYSVFDILILARNYDTRSGGMFVLEADGKPTAVIIKATLSNGRYPNKWIKEGVELKYYLKSISGNFGVHYKPNKAIIDNHQLQVVTFTRDSEISPFIYRGIFCYHDLLNEDESAKAFILRRNDDFALTTVDSKYDRELLEKKVRQSELQPRNDRLQRLTKAKKRPSTYIVKSRVYSRNPDVIAEVLFQAQGICQGCAKDAPFLRSTDGAPYLEVHHRIPLAMGGDDTVENAIALCPNCHRERHFGSSYVNKIGQIFDIPQDITEIDAVETTLQETLNVKIT